MRWVFRILVALAVLVAIAFGGTVWYLRRTIDQKGAERRAAMDEAFAEHNAKVLEDHQWLAELDFFQPAAGPDAGPFLNPRLAWDMPERIRAKWEVARPKDVPGIELDKALADTLRGKDKNAWLDLEPGLFEKVDFEWMTKLAGFGHWEIQTNSPWTVGERFDWIEAPIPAFHNLLSQSKLRLAKGIHDGQPAAAGAEVRQLARLCYSTEILIGEMVAIALLGLEDEARRRAAEKGLPVEGWTTYDEPSRKRMKRALWALQAYTSLDTPAGREKDFQAFKVGRCAALTEATFFALVLRPLLLDARKADFERLGRNLETAKECRLPKERKDWAAPDDPANNPILGAKACQVAGSLDQSGDMECRLSQVLAFVPGGKQYVGEVFLAIAGPEWFRHYRE